MNPVRLAFYGNAGLAGFCFGVAIALDYAGVRGWIGIFPAVIAVAGVGFLLLAIGWFRRLHPRGPP